MVQRGRAAKGNYGSHTLRKTWGYQQRVTFGSDVPQLMEAFGHSSQKQTLAYLGIQADERMMNDMKSGNSFWNRLGCSEDDIRSKVDNKIAEYSNAQDPHFGQES